MAKAAVQKTIPIRRNTEETGRLVLQIVVSGRLTINNHLYATGKTGRRYVDAKARRFVRDFEKQLGELSFELPPCTPFALAITFYCPDGSSYQEANINKFDVEGSHKAALDCFIRAARLRYRKEFDILDRAEQNKIKALIDDSWCWKAEFNKRLMSSQVARPALNLEFPEGYTIITIRTLSQLEIEVENG